ncbi:putative endo-beta-N-acetylglucosaminidase F2 [Enterococcus faecalis TX0012]|nr:putative endo-beta-N-acetylglucosaminidase F2 [Enterococcus faecalis TX0012]
MSFIVIGFKNPVTVYAESKENYIGYFRAWRDKTSNPSINKNKISELPKEVDIAVVFPNGEESANFWNDLPKQIEILHKNETKVIRNFPIRALYSQYFKDPIEAKHLHPFDNNTSGYEKRAKEICNYYLDLESYDGLVVNAEESLSGEMLQRAAGVINELSKAIGKKSNTGKMFVYDTNLPGTDSLFYQTHKVYNYVFSDAYGRSLSSLDSEWETFRELIEPEQFVIGFSFYEEYGTAWKDTEEPFNTSRAYQFAKWEPKNVGGKHKGGIFGYAVDRDGVITGDDKIKCTDFSWSIRLSNEIKK